MGGMEAQRTDRFFEFKIRESVLKGMGACMVEVLVLWFLRGM